MHEASLREHAAALSKREYSSRELTDHLLARAAEHAALNAFITLNPEQACQQADQADQLLRQGDTHPLCGIPIAHKDLFCTRDVLTTCASRILYNFFPPYNAGVVQRLQDAGSVMLGKTNMDEFAMGSSGETSFYGATRNPWRADHVAGGSSSGSAAAVAARLVPAATGSDTGGSIRQPAAFCGLTGIKPSYGRVSRYGMVAFASSLDQGGVLARDAADCALMLHAMSGFDMQDSTSLEAETPDYPALLEKPLEPLKIGLPEQFFDGAVAPDILARVEDALQALEKLGHTRVKVSLPHCAATLSCYYVLAAAEASSNLARYDGIRYGRRAETEELGAMYRQTRAEGFGKEVQQRILTGAYVLSASQYEAYYVKAQRVRRQIADEFATALGDCDLLLGPTTPSTAFPLGDRLDDPVAMYQNDLFTAPVNLAGLPGLSAPVGFDADGHPIGMQLIGRYGDESTLLQLAHAFQRETDWHQQCPEDYR